LQDREEADRAARSALEALQKANNWQKAFEEKPTLALGTQIDDSEEAKEKRRKDTERKRDRANANGRLVVASQKAPRGPLALQQAIDNSPQRTWVPTLRRILAAILESPDDEKRRTLRCSHAAFKRDFGHPLDPSVQSALEAIGFSLVFREKQPKKTSDDAPDDDDDDATDEPYFVNREPDPMIDLDAWSHWFDNINNCKLILDNQQDTTQQKDDLPPGQAPFWYGAARTNK